mgnify:CR=1 FL=1
MKKQTGSTLVISLILLTVITLVAVYSLESGSLQAKMITNSLFSTITYQECRNEQEANISFYNLDYGKHRVDLLDLIVSGNAIEEQDTFTEDTTRAVGVAAPASDMAIRWDYLREEPAFRDGFDLDTDSQIKTYLYEHDCTATFGFAQNSQTLGAIVDALGQTGNVN